MSSKSKDSKVMHLSLTSTSPGKKTLSTAVASLDPIDPKAFRTFIAQKTLEHLTFTRPLRKAAKDAVDSSTPKDWNSCVAGSRGKGTDVDGDLDLVVQNKEAMTANEHKTYAEAIYLAFVENIRNLGLDYHVKFKQKKRADTFELVDPVLKKVVFSVDVVWAFTTMELYIPVDYFSGKDFLQDAVRGLKMYFRRPGLPGMKGVNCEMLVLFAHSLKKNSTVAAELFLSVILSLAELKDSNAFAVFHIKVNLQLRRQKVPEGLVYEESKIQSYANEARRLLSAIRKNPVKTVADMSAIFD